MLESTLYIIDDQTVQPGVVLSTDPAHLQEPCCVRCRGFRGSCITMSDHDIVRLAFPDAGSNVFGFHAGLVVLEARCLSGRLVACSLTHTFFAFVVGGLFQWKSNRVRWFVYIVSHYWTIGVPGINCRVLSGNLPGAGIPRPTSHDSVGG